MRAAIYCRISKDRVGAGLGVARQRQDCDMLAEQRGWQVIAVYEDNDISAYSGRTRPGYRRLLADIRAGQVDAVIAWHTDRLHRSPAELEEYIATCEDHGVPTVTVRAGDLDLATAAGRMVARMLGAAARHESEQKSERVRRAREQEARTGRPHTHLGYGYRREADAHGEPSWRIHEPEAAIIREIADRLLTGDTLAGIARDLNSRGVVTPDGLTGRWRGANIRAMITAGRYCGWREWTPALGRGDRGRGRGMGTLVAEGTWPAILEKHTTEALRLLMTDPTRRTGGRPGRARYLLSAGLARCGRCGSPLAGHADTAHDSRRYVCVSQPGLDRCGRLTVSARPLDEFVTEALLAALTDAPAMTKPARQPSEEPMAEILRSRRRLEDLATLFAEEQITRAEWLAARKPIEARIAQQEQLVTTSSRLVLLGSLPTEPTRLRAAWLAMTLDQQRVIAEAVLDRVVVHPATRGGNRFDPGRVELRWRL